MKKIALAATFFPLLLGAGELYEGYTYFGVGVQNIDYSENLTLSTGEHVSSQASASSPVYTSGSLMRVNDRYDFTIDLASTLLPTKTTESWTVNGALAQKNDFDAMISSMQLLGHYKLDNNHRIAAGGTYKLNSFKRYNFKDPNGVSLTDPDTGARLGLLEERVATLYLSGGYWYESAPHSSESVRFRFNALAGIPIWNQATNTEFEKVTFNSPSGYKLEANAYLGYPVMKGLEIGLFAGYSLQDKTKTDVASDGHTKWPENTLEIWQGGISAVWNFSKQ